MSQVDTYISKLTESNQQKTNEQKEMESKAEEIERQIVRFTNIDNESFTHAFRGVSITVKSGESYIGRMTECDHLATHLARKILSRKVKESIPPERGQQLWTQEKVQELKKKILSPVATESTENMSETELRKKDLEQLKEKYDKPKNEQINLENIKRTEIMKELSERGIKVSLNDSKEQLLAKLMDAEQQGITAKE